MDADTPNAFFELDENQGVGVNDASSLEMALEEQVWSCHEMVRFVIAGCDQPVWLNSMSQVQSLGASQEDFPLQGLHLKFRLEF